VRAARSSSGGAAKAARVSPSEGVAARSKRRRLSRSAEFDRVYRHGRSASNRHLVVYAFPRERTSAASVRPPEEGEDGPRLGVSVGRRVGGAVVRNRVKRVVREAFWSLTGLPDDHDYVVVARPDASGLAEREGLEGVSRELRELVTKLGFTQEGAGFTQEGAGDAASG
jgi:ribonuclease P protein component